MSPLDVSEVVVDGDLAEKFVIERASRGGFQRGGFQQQTTMLTAWGVVNPASARELRMIPEGDQISGAMVFFSTTEMFPTSEDKMGTSDVLNYRNDRYRIHNVMPWGKAGYFMAIAERMAGQ